jgi:hypothetical protein
MKTMVEQYQRIHGTNTPGAVSAKIVLIQHCQALESKYKEAADEAEATARAHRDLIGR